MKLYLLRTRSLPCRTIEGFNLDVGVGLLNFGQSRMRSAVGQNQPIGIEVIVVRLVAEVSAVCPEVFSICALFANALVNPVPDKAAVRPGLRFE